MRVISSLPCELQQDRALILLGAPKKVGVNLKPLAAWYPEATEPSQFLTASLGPLPPGGAGTVWLQGSVQAVSGVLSCVTQGVLIKAR